MTLYEVLTTEDIDESIRAVLVKLNIAGYDTKYSCSGAPIDHEVHKYDTGKNGNLVLYDNETRCYLVLQTNGKEKNSYIKKIREQLYGTNWYVRYIYNTHWNWLINGKRWSYLTHDLEFEDRIVLEYKCEFSDNVCRKAWNVLLERLL